MEIKGYRRHMHNYEMFRYTWSRSQIEGIIVSVLM